jgi:hypothetical protein
MKFSYKIVVKILIICLLLFKFEQIEASSNIQRLKEKIKRGFMIVSGSLLLN